MFDANLLNYIVSKENDMKNFINHKFIYMLGGI